MNIEATIKQLEASGNLRKIPCDGDPSLIDLSSNDYLGLSEDIILREEFFEKYPAANMLMSSSASRLLGACQSPYSAFEHRLADDYGTGRAALLFNSGYHANTGLVSALADKHTLVIADKLVHASIIDGIKLSGAQFVRFAHNNYTHLQHILETKARDFSSVIIIAESVYSMDGDKADIPTLVQLKKLHPDALLYIDEAHAVGVIGPGGLGETVRMGLLHEVDILVGTLGKALASMGAFAILSPRMREYMINKARSLIFSTALPPLQIMWSHHMWKHSLEADTKREKLEKLAILLAEAIPGGAPSHIRPLIVGDPIKAINISKMLLESGYKVLPIRTPTVPPGTERLRFSLNANILPEHIAKLKKLL